MKIYYWSPFISYVATTSSVINSLISINKFSKQKIDCKVINVFNEWNNYQNLLNKNNICILNLNKYLNIKYLPIKGFIQSRFTYLITYLLSFFKLHSLIKKNKPNYLVMHLITSIPLSLLMLFSYDTKFILRISGLPKMNFLRKFLWKSLNKKLYKIICPTKMTKEFLLKEKIFSEDKLVVIHDPIINHSLINELRGNKKDELVIKDEYIVSIGRLTYQKNFEFLIKNFLKISQIHPNLKLLILGDGENKNTLKKMIKHYKLDNNIILKGNVKNIYPYLNSAKFFVLTSRWEDPGFVIIESMFMKKIVLSSDCKNGPIEIINDGVNGFLFKNLNKEDFFKKFNYVYEMTNNNEHIINQIRLDALKTTKTYTLFSHYKNIIKLFR
ncbi:glycosyltransferase [Candidatus Pelagibacter sp.]|nr:glycosyltransferase [Candidatus Pelagibacter sp.]